MNDLIHLQCSGSKLTPNIKKKKKKGSNYQKLRKNKT